MQGGWFACTRHNRGVMTTVGGLFEGSRGNKRKAPQGEEEEEEEEEDVGLD